MICDSTLFAGCYNTTINSDIKRIYASAFNGCRRLTKVFIPASVDRVDARAFSGCVNLVSLVVDPKNKVYDSREDCNCIVESQSNKIICGSSVAVIPKSVSSIGKYAFSGMNTPTVLRFKTSNKEVFEQKTLPFLQSLDKNMLVFPGHGEPFKINEAKYL